MLQVNQPTEEQTQQENSKKEELHNSVKERLLGDPLQKEILKDLGLSPAVEEKPAVKKVKEAPVEEEVEEEVSATEEVEEEAQEEETEEEEVISKSKVQKRFDELTARLKMQEKEIEDLKSSKAEPQDAISKQLEEMTTEQLKAAKTEVRRAQMKAGDDDAKLNELLSLEDKIDSALQNAPGRFTGKQIEALSKAIRNSGVDEETYKKVFPSAKAIYDKYPLFQKDINGQAAAWDMALEHHNIVSSTVKTGDKTKETELKRQVNNLKRKTTLDTKSGAGDKDKVALDKLKKDAIGGTYQQKVNLVRSHPVFNVAGLIPEEFREK